jgi:hypothetical protein
MMTLSSSMAGGDSELRESRGIRDANRAVLLLLLVKDNGSCAGGGGGGNGAVAVAVPPLLSLLFVLVSLLLGWLPLRSRSLVAQLRNRSETTSLLARLRTGDGEQVDATSPVVMESSER